MASSTSVGGPSMGDARPAPPAASRLGRAITGSLLVAIAASSVSASLALVGLDVGPFVTENQAPPAARAAVFVVLLSSFAGACAACAFVSLAGGPSAASLVHRWGRRLSPLSVACIVPLFGAYRAWSAKPLSFLLLLAVTVLLFEATLRAAFEEGAGELGESLAAIQIPAVVRRLAPAAVVVLASAGYAAFTSYYSIQQHQRLATLAFDLGIYDNLLYNALHGHFFRSPVLFGPDGGNYIAGHAEFIMLAYVPLYALLPRAEMLLVLQSCLMGFAAVPLYKFARTQLPPWTAVVVALAYLCYAPLHGPNFYDFHWIVTAIFFHFWLYYAIATERRFLSVGCVVALLLVREDVSVGLAILGVFLVMTGIRVRFGLLLAVVSVCYFAVVRFIVMPWAGSWWFENIYKDLIPQGEAGFGGIIRTIITNPAFFLGTLIAENKLVYLLHLFVPVAFIPWRRAILAFLASAGFFFTVMTTGYGPTLSIAFQYTTHWIPYVFAATVLGLRVIGKEPARRRAATGALAFAVLAHSLVFGALFQHETFIGGFGRVPFRITAGERARYEDMKALVRRIPRDATVAATESEMPHVSNRLTAYSMRDHSGGADYLLVNRDMRSHVHTHESLVEANTSYKYGLLERRGSLFLFQKGHSSPETATAMRELGVP